MYVAQSEGARERLTITYCSARDESEGASEGGRGPVTEVRCSIGE